MGFILFLFIKLYFGMALCQQIVDFLHYSLWYTLPCMLGKHLLLLFMND